MITLFNKNFNNSRSGTSKWIAPSNIALVKYWGKFGDQLPSNPSVSLTLSQAHTETSLEWNFNPSRDSMDVSFKFEGKNNKQFSSRIKKILEHYQREIPQLKQFSFDFTSKNSFPHSAGIASSASGMSAFALNLASCLREFSDSLDDETYFYKIASSLGRQASGSACRSFYGPITTWGEVENFESCNKYSAPLNGCHQVFSSYQDSILILSSEEKTVSSSAGHALMNDHPYRDIRFSHAKSNCKSIHKAMLEGNFDEFIRIVEEEALGLHGLMMTSNPSFILMNANTLSVIERVRTFRKLTKLPLCFTLDAGPNIHLLYPESIKDEVGDFIQSELVELLEGNNVLYDRVGNGPKQA